MSLYQPRTVGKCEFDERLFCYVVMDTFFSSDFRKSINISRSISESVTRFITALSWSSFFRLSSIRKPTNTSLSDCNVLMIRLKYFLVKPTIINYIDDSEDTFSSVQ